MNAFRVAAPLLLIAAVCLPVASNASPQITQPAAPATGVANTTQQSATPEETPRLTIGVSDPNTRLILPWFLNDIVNAINTRPSPDQFWHTVGHDL
ncbi:hypothetical protein [Paraburkholderia sp.]|uniref:hypothetical protein n=1 Tax=Paraburkholderia sp. TaxID=1926495 RepID=UPI002F42BD22